MIDPLTATSTALTSFRHHQAYVRDLDTEKGLLQAAHDELESVSLDEVYQGRDSPAEASGSIAAEAPDTVGLSQAQKTELHRRVSAHRADPSTAVSWEQVRGKLFPDQT